MFREKLAAGWPVILLLLTAPALQAAVNPPARTVLHGNVPSVTTRLTPTGPLPGNTQLALSLGLPLRNVPELNQFLADLYNPGSTHYHQFLSSAEFTGRYGPTEQDYARVTAFARANGLNILGTYSNRLVLEVQGNVSNIEAAFRITLNDYRHPTEARNFFAPATDPSVPTNVPMADLWGLSDYSTPQPLVLPVAPLATTPLNYNGSGPSGSYQGTDFRNAYAPGASLVGSGQIVAVAEFDGFYSNDIPRYEAQCGYTNVPVQTNLLNGVSGKPGYSGVPNAVAEVSLDIELAIAMAPGLSKVLVYEGSSPYTVFNRIAADNQAKQISCSWSFGYGPTQNWLGGGGTSTLDSILSQMVAQGQAFFQASGDSDAYAGSQPLSTTKGPIPVDSIYVTSVGGTTLTMAGSGSAWSSETVWNRGSNVGSGGGISPNYHIPSWQTNVNMSNNGGSATYRNIPDVAMTADAVYVIYSNNLTGYFGGTSCAAPLWAGFTALVNQQSVARTGTNVGFLNPALYTIAAGNNYTNCFHDITTGNNIGNNTAGLFAAATNYDLATGLGTPNGLNLINALAPTPPYFLIQPASQTVTNGANVVFNPTVTGSFPLSFQWRFNGTNLPATGNLSGVTNNLLSIAPAATNNTGNYQLVVSNSHGAVTSSIAMLNVGFVPAVTAQPADLTVLSGSNAFFNATVSGSLPLAYQWSLNGTNLVNGAGIAGANTNTLTLTAVTTNSNGSYTLSVTNNFGAVSSSAALTVVLPAAITSSSLTNRVVQCGSNQLTLTVVASGTAPLNVQWSLVGQPVDGATNLSFSLTNLHSSSPVAVIVTNAYGSAASNAVITVIDTLPPVITLNSTNPFYLELGNPYAEPGATAWDACAGAEAVGVSGTVNAGSLSTNTITYTAGDGNGNTNTATRTTIVRDTTPPTITWSFTNLVLAAGSNCTALMPDATGTNYILATDVSGALTISQSPTNAAILPLGTNLIVLTVQDASGNTTYSTNQIVVQDQTSPVLTDQPQSQTNYAGTTASLTANATACTPVAFQWFDTNGMVTAATNSSLTLSNLTLAATGNYFVIATAAGGSVTSSVATLTVELVPTSLMLTSGKNPAGFKDSVSFTANVAPTNLTGTVQFFTNGTAFQLETLAAGQAVSSDPGLLPRGTNLISAVYSGDANDLPATNQLAQIVTNHPPVAAPAFYTNSANFTLTISIADLATNWSDVDGDVVSLADVGVSTNGITLTNTGTALLYFNSNNVPDQFICTISDGWGGTNSQLVNIAPAPPPDTTPLITGVAAAANGSVQLTLGGAEGHAYILESTTNLMVAGSWLTVATNTLDATGVWQYTDSDATNFQSRFYRLKLAQ